MSCTIQVGQRAPSFTCTAVINGCFKEISLPPYTEAKLWLVLVFFPRAWSYICPTEIRAFSTRIDEFLYSRNCAVAFASTDNEHSLKAWSDAPKEEGGLGDVHVPLISDSSHALSRDYGVLIENEGIAQRAMFIIDPHGKVRAIYINDTDVGRSVDETQRVLDALAFIDSCGEGCPADWKKGDKGTVGRTAAAIDGPIEPLRGGRKNKTRNSGEVVKRTWSIWTRPKPSHSPSNDSHSCGHDSTLSTGYGSRNNSVVSQHDSIFGGRNSNVATDKEGLMEKGHSAVYSGANLAHEKPADHADGHHSPSHPPTSPSDDREEHSDDGLDARTHDAAEGLYREDSTDSPQNEGVGEDGVAT